MQRPGVCLILLSNKALFIEKKGKKKEEEINQLASHISLQIKKLSDFPRENQVTFLRILNKKTQRYDSV
jgi:hypothetical protein